MIYLQKIFLLSLIFVFGIQASYQPEHHIKFEEDVKNLQFIEKNSLEAIFGKAFFENLPFQPLLQGLLAGIYPYSLLMVHEDEKFPYVVIKSTSSYAYIVGKPKFEQLDLILQKLQEFQSLVLVCDESLQTYFVEHGFSLQARIEFEPLLKNQFEQKSLPDGLSLQKLDLDLIKQSEWYEFLCSILGSSQRFIDVSFGYALVNEQGISVAQAYGAMIDNRICEIGVITDQNYRGKGYVLYPAHAVIEESFARGLKPVWSCNSENIASLKTALKFGFKIKRHYVFLKKF